MNGQCDGGGNRYASQVELGTVHPLRKLFPDLESVPAGVCSIQTGEETSPWIVCPRRLLALGREHSGQRRWQSYAEAQTLKCLGYPARSRVGVWSEVKIKYEEKGKTFDYTFDYVLVPVGNIETAILAKRIGMPLKATEKTLGSSGYGFVVHNGESFVEDFPVGIPSIIEIMTSSTSGGNKRKRTTIPMAFEDAMQQKTHEAPGINYRQVWARMVSQLIVKSEVALAWGGRAIWVVQDNLVDYICKSTALDVREFLSDTAGEVNMLSFSYGDIRGKKSGIIDLIDAALYAGPISSGRQQDGKSFQDMIRAPLCPSRDRLVSLLLKQRPRSIITVSGAFVVGRDSQ